VNFLALLVLLALVALPGVALAATTAGDEADPLAFVAVAAISGAALWVTAFWFLRLAPLAGFGLRGLAAVVSAAALAGLFVTRRRLAATLAAAVRREHRPLLLTLAALAALRFAPLLIAAAPPGADMSMHAYMTRLILEADGVPRSYLPLLPIREFGSYAAGLPALGAMTAALGAGTAVDGAFAAAVLAQLLATLAVYAYVRERAGATAALLAALLAGVATRDPQHFFEWGGNPTVLSLAFATLGLWALEGLGDERLPRRTLLVPLLFAAAVLTHAVIPCALAYVLPPLLLYRLVRLKGAARGRMLLRGMLLAAVLALLVAPALADIAPSVSPAERAWIMRWQRLPIHVPPGPFWMLPLGLAIQIGVRLGAIYAVWLAAALLARRRWRCAPITEELILGAGVLLLVANARVWLLPGSYALLPDRTLLLIVPCSARIIAASLDQARARLWLPATALRRRLFAACFGGSLAAGAVLWYLLGLRDVSVTADDREAIAWIARQTPPGAVIANNYGDAGLWIPALALRAVVTPHVNVTYFDEVAPWRDRSPDFLFVGARRVYDIDSPYVLAEVRSRPERYREVFTSGNAAVFRVLPSVAAPARLRSAAR